MFHPEGGSLTDPEPRRRTVPAREHYICGSVALAVVGLFAFATYSLLVGVAMNFGVLATTMLVFALAISWFLLWELFVVAWEWRAGRFSLRE